MSFLIIISNLIEAVAASQEMNDSKLQFEVVFQNIKTQEKVSQQIDNADGDVDCIKACLDEAISMSSSTKDKECNYIEHPQNDAIIYLEEKITSEFTSLKKDLESYLLSSKLGLEAEENTNNSKKFFFASLLFLDVMRFKEKIVSHLSKTSSKEYLILFNNDTKVKDLIKFAILKKTLQLVTETKIVHLYPTILAAYDEKLQTYVLKDKSFYTSALKTMLEYAFIKYSDFIRTKMLNLSEDCTDQTQNPDCSHVKLESDAQQENLSVSQMRQKNLDKKITITHTIPVLLELNLQNTCTASGLYDVFIRILKACESKNPKPSAIEIKFDSRLFLEHLSFLQTTSFSSNSSERSNMLNTALSDFNAMSENLLKCHSIILEQLLVIGDYLGRSRIETHISFTYKRCYNNYTKNKASEKTSESQIKQKVWELSKIYENTYIIFISEIFNTLNPENRAKQIYRNEWLDYYDTYELNCDNADNHNPNKTRFLEEKHSQQLKKFLNTIEDYNYENQRSIDPDSLNLLDFAMKMSKIYASVLYDFKKLLLELNLEAQKVDLQIDTINSQDTLNATQISKNQTSNNSRRSKTYQVTVERGKINNTVEATGDNIAKGLSGVKVLDNNKSDARFTTEVYTSSRKQSKKAKQPKKQQSKKLEETKMERDVIGDKNARKRTCTVKLPQVQEENETNKKTHDQRQISADLRNGNASAFQKKSNKSYDVIQKGKSTNKEMLENQSSIKLQRTDTSNNKKDAPQDMQLNMGETKRFGSAKTDTEEKFGILASSSATLKDEISLHSAIANLESELTIKCECNGAESREDTQNICLDKNDNNHGVKDTQQNDLMKNKEETLVERLARDENNIEENNTQITKDTIEHVCFTEPPPYVPPFQNLPIICGDPLAGHLCRDDFGNLFCIKTVHHNLMYNLLPQACSVPQQTDLPFVNEIVSNQSNFQQTQENFAAHQNQCVDRNQFSFHNNIVSLDTRTLIPATMSGCIIRADGSQEHGTYEGFVDNPISRCINGVYYTMINDILVPVFYNA